MSEITVTPLTTTIGARMDGVDLGEPLDPATAQQIRDALATHAVLASSPPGRTRSSWSIR